MRKLLILWIAVGLNFALTLYCLFRPQPLSAAAVVDTSAGWQAAPPATSPSSVATPSGVQPVAAANVGAGAVPGAKQPASIPSANNLAARNGQVPGGPPPSIPVAPAGSPLGAPPPSKLHPDDLALANQLRVAAQVLEPLVEKGGRVPASARASLIALQPQIARIATDAKLEGDKSLPLFNVLNRYAVDATMLRRYGGGALEHDLAALRYSTEVQVRGFYGEAAAKLAAKNFDKLELK